jgi:hypothetical protein
MNRLEIVQTLCSEVAGRIAKHHTLPSSIFITVDEMTELTQLFPSNLIFEAMNQTAKVVKKNPATERTVILQTLQTTTNKLLQQGQALGKYFTFPSAGPTAKHAYRARDKAHAVPPTQKRVHQAKEEAVESLRELFQNSCTYGDWCLTETDVEQLLQSSNESTLRDTFKVLGRFSEDQQGVCFDDLQRLLDQAAWNSAKQELMQQGALHDHTRRTN